MPDYSNGGTHKEYATKNKANTALGFGIAGTALGLAGLGSAYMASQANATKTSEGTNCETVREIYDAKISYMQDRYEDRARIDAELFALYERGNRDSFANYVAQRDGFDTLSKEISGLRAELDVCKAIRPYQDKLIQCEIDNARKDAKFDLLWRTRYMVTGQIVLPSDNTVKGLPASQNGCCVFSDTVVE